MSEFEKQVFGIAERAVTVAPRIMCTAAAANSGMIEETMNNQPVNVKFADTYVGCATLGNIMGLHEETVRKRAKRGKIPGALVNGKWTFQHVDLVAKGVQPFASNPLPGGQVLSVCGTPVPPPIPLPIPQIARINRTDVIFVLDRSGSMNGLMGQARKNLGQQIATLRDAIGPSDEYRVTVICFDDKVTKTLSKADVAGLLSTDQYYLGANGMTAMNDAIREAIGSTRNDERGQAFLISIVTDGGENASSTNAPRLKSEIEALIATGRYTFAYAGPDHRMSTQYAASIGIPTGNVTAWEQSVRGTMDLGIRTNSALQSYASRRLTGAMSSTSFYAQPVVSNPQDFAGKLGSQMAKLSASAFKVERVMDHDPLVIAKFAEAKLGGFHKGKIYYQLTSSEKVQDYKDIVIQDTATGAFYAGRDTAAKLLGIPNFSGTVRIRPGQLGEFKVFVQSTSVNRKLVPGTAVVYLP